MIRIIGKYKYLFILLCLILGSITYILLRGDMEMEKVFNVTSPAFKNGDSIPIKYTGKGIDVSIPLNLNNVSSLGKSIAIIMDDPDAPTPTPFVHWLIWNIPTTITMIPEGIPNDKEVAILNGAIQGKNDFGEIGYMGPNPPSGTHAYKIKVYVLDRLLDLKAGSSKASLENAMKGHIIQSTLLEGKFSHQ